MALRRLQNRPGKARRLLSVPHPHAQVGGPRGTVDLHPDTLPPLGGQAFTLSKAVGRFIALACCLPPLFCVPPESKRGLSLRSPVGSAWQIDVFSCARRQITENRICIYMASISTYSVRDVISSSIFPSLLPQTRWLRPLAALRPRCHPYGDARNSSP